MNSDDTNINDILSDLRCKGELELYTIELGGLAFICRPLSYAQYVMAHQVLYTMASFRQLVLEHVSLVGISSGLATLLGLATGIFATRVWGRDFLPAVNALASMGQTFPPVAVLALAVPAVGFGFKPTIIALLLYGLLPIIRNTITGIETVDKAVLEAARGICAPATGR